MAAICCNHATPRWLLNRKEFIFLYQNVYVDVQNSFVCNSPSWKEPGCLSTGECLNCGPPMPGILLSDKKK